MRFPLTLHAGDTLSVNGTSRRVERTTIFNTVREALAFVHNKETDNG